MPSFLRGWSGLVLLLAAACAGGKERAGVQAPSRLDKDYPAAFVQARGPAGVGFQPLAFRRQDASYEAAVQMARRQLAWTLKVRVQGERLFERTGGGLQEYRGENIQLLEVPDLDPAVCRLDTVETGRHIWVFARQAGAAAGAGKARFAAEAPSWLAELPRQKGWYYATGSAPVSYRDEPGSWELATYHALVELALAVQTRTRHLQRTFSGVLTDVNAQIVDTRLEGFGVVGRWRDRGHAYVLARVPISGVASLLEQ